ncbi:hypothetical protein [Desulfofundulus salinus]|nr:hypothetical protein [Desulfofundulus salinum]
MEKGELHAGTAKEIYFPAIGVLATAGKVKALPRELNPVRNPKAQNWYS